MSRPTSSRQACTRRGRVAQESAASGGRFGPQDFAAAMRLLFGNAVAGYVFVPVEATLLVRRRCVLAFGEDHVAPRSAADRPPLEWIVCRGAQNVVWESVGLKSVWASGRLWLALGPNAGDGSAEGSRALRTKCAAAFAQHALSDATWAWSEPARCRADGLVAAIVNDLPQGGRLCEVARSMHLSASRCSHLAREAFGCSYTALRDQLRIRRAAELLLDAGLKTEAVAREIGMGDASYFYRFFKKRTGRTPAQYREALRAGDWWVLEEGHRPLPASVPA